MNKLKSYITNRNSYLYMVTAFRPEITNILGTGKQEAYITYGDPIGYNNITKQFIQTVFGDIDLECLVPRRCLLYGAVVHPYECTHFLSYDQRVDRYEIFSRKKSLVYIENLCQWFVSKIFDVYDKESKFPIPIYFTGEIL